jgi:site-specific recombinase XerD
LGKPINSLIDLIGNLYALANKGHDTRALQAYLGHRNIQHTVRYTELSPTRFKDFWRV